MTIAAKLLQLLQLEERFERPRPLDNPRPRKREARRIVVFGQLPNPSFDYYFAARLEPYAKLLPISYVDIREGRDKLPDAQGAVVIICRYASSAALDWIDENSDRLAAVCLFIDDDIPAVVTGDEASLSYRWRLLTRGIWPLRRLNKHLDFVFASTERLVERHHEARLLPPKPLPQHWQNKEHVTSTQKALRIAYHATGIHVQEHRFLTPIIERVLIERANIVFEVFAPGALKSQWQRMDRVEIRQQLSWSAYVEDARTRHIDIMLVPLLSSRVNDCRSATKKIDTARYGAAGLFSASPAYGQADGSGELCLPNDPQVWYEQLLMLIDDRESRHRHAQSTRRLVMQMSDPTNEPSLLDQIGVSICS